MFRILDHDLPLVRVWHEVDEFEYPSSWPAAGEHKQGALDQVSDIHHCLAVANDALGRTAATGLTVTFSHWCSNFSAILRAIGSIVVEPLMTRFDVSASEL